MGVEIKFAYQTFAWNNSAKGKAAVHVIIVGLSAHPKEKAIYQTINGEIQRLVVKNISPYLIEGSSLAVKSRSKPFGNIAPIIYGNKVVDGGHLLLSRLEKEELVRKEPLAESWIKKLLGSDEFLNGRERYCLWLADATEAEISAMPLVKEKVERVRKVRLNSRDPGAQKLAERSHQFRDLNNPESFILVPLVSSENRHYVPIGFFNSDVISTNANSIIPNATLYEFGILTSEMHNDWMRTVAGRLESRYRYSATLVYNTFPWPNVSESKRKEIEALAEEVVLTREDYPTMTMAQLYNPDTMPDALKAAHKVLDRAVEKLYREKPFRDASERLGHLFNRYEKLIAEEQSSKRK
ncbi:hypothetical protein OURE66S_01825 [Oligella ureolytica]